MLCLICWLDGQTKWVLDPAYHEHVTGHAPDLANDEIADALLDGRLALTRAPGLPYPSASSGSLRGLAHYAVPRPGQRWRPHTGQPMYTGSTAR
jgi:hypothetical protein